MGIVELHIERERAKAMSAGLRPASDGREAALGLGAMPNVGLGGAGADDRLYGHGRLREEWPGLGDKFGDGQKIVDEAISAIRGSGSPSFDGRQTILSDAEIKLIGELGADFDDPDGLWTELSDASFDDAPAPTKRQYLLHAMGQLWSEAGADGGLAATHSRLDGGEIRRPFKTDRALGALEGIWADMGASARRSRLEDDPDPFSFEDWTKLGDSALRPAEEGSRDGRGAGLSPLASPAPPSVLPAPPAPLAPPISAGALPAAPANGHSCCVCGAPTRPSARSGAGCGRCAACEAARLRCRQDSAWPRPISSDAPAAACGACGDSPCSCGGLAAGGCACPCGAFPRKRRVRPSRARNRGQVEGATRLAGDGLDESHDAAFQPKDGDVEEGASSSAPRCCGGPDGPDWRVVFFLIVAVLIAAALISGGGQPGGSIPR